MTTETDDAVALLRLQGRYADVVTRRAWDELSELFLPDTEILLDTVTATPRLLAGPEEFGRFVAGAVERFDYFAFVVLNSVVDVDGPDVAGGRMFMCEIRHEAGAPADATGSWHNAYGVYQDRYRRVDGRWWFAERRYRSMARTGPEPAVFGLPPDMERDDL
ncbi:MAG: nuclear transport factor 2 family protein [Acidimicrobiales bacterium]